MRAVSCLAWVIGLGWLAAVGCGSSDDESPGSSGTSTGTGASSTGGGGGTSSGTGATGAGASGGSTSTGGAGGAGGNGTGGGVAGGGTGGAGGNGGSAGAGGSGGSSASAIQTVFVIVMENKAWCEVEGNMQDAPYLNGTLLPQGSRAQNYKGPNDGNLHPSEPNYIWMEAGDNLGITTDDDPATNHQATTDHLVTYLDTAGVSWKSYQQGITGAVCPLSGVGDYKPKHNPNIFFDDSTGTNDPNDAYCIAHNRPLTELDADLTNGTAARYNFITPDQCHDMHDSCPPLDNSIAQGDAWLQEWIPKIQASAQYQNGGAILVTWDEAESTLPSGNLCCILGNCPIGMIVLSPLAKPGGYTNSLVYDHSSFLKSMQEIFGAGPLLRHAGDANTNDLADLFATFP